jgi:uncharacterized membrane protein YbaN (DUF454 family)
MGVVGARPNSSARKAIGWALLAVGVAGCVLPVMPGIPLALAGLIILARDYLWARRALGHAKRRAVRMRQQARAKRAENAMMTRNNGAEEA